MGIPFYSHASKFTLHIYFCVYMCVCVCIKNYIIFLNKIYYKEGDWNSVEGNFP